MGRSGSKYIMINTGDKFTSCVMKYDYACCHHTYGVWYLLKTYGIFSFVFLYYYTLLITVIHNILYIIICYKYVILSTTTYYL